jgi:hypothetical protein
MPRLAEKCALMTVEAGQIDQTNMSVAFRLAYINVNPEWSDSRNCTGFA